MKIIKIIWVTVLIIVAVAFGSVPALLLILAVLISKLSKGAVKLMIWVLITIVCIYYVAVNGLFWF